MSVRSGSIFAGVVVAAALLSVAPPAQAEEIRFSQFDVPTVFFINKSDDRNRVDYGMRMDGDCNPFGREAVFQYWREFEGSPPVRTHGLNMMERVAYGISDQHVIKNANTRDEWLIRLKQLPRPITVSTQKLPDGKCVATARTTIGGVEADLQSVYVKLAGIMSVDYIEIKGRNRETGTPVLERVKK